MRLYVKFLGLIIAAVAIQHGLESPDVQLTWFGLRCNFAYLFRDEAMVNQLIDEIHHPLTPDELAMLEQDLSGEPFFRFEPPRRTAASRPPGSYIQRPHPEPDNDPPSTRSTPPCIPGPAELCAAR